MSAPGILAPAADSQETSIGCLRGIAVVVSRHFVLPLFSLPLFCLARRRDSHGSRNRSSRDPPRRLQVGPLHVRLALTDLRQMSEFINSYSYSRTRPWLLRKPFSPSAAILRDDPFGRRLLPAAARSVVLCLTPAGRSADDCADERFQRTCR